MRRAIALLLCCLVTAQPLRAQDPAGVFDYYVLALSWSPNWCAAGNRGSPQCQRDHGWVLHGLWPQYEVGWPDYCRSPAADPDRAQTAAMADIMGSSGSAWHQWKKHGRCSGLEAQEYFALMREAFEAFVRPPVFRALPRAVRLPASVVEESFLKANPGLEADQITITCRDDRIAEARICLTRDLAPRRCGPDVIRDCPAREALMDPVTSP